MIFHNRDSRTVEKYLKVYAEPESYWSESDLENLGPGWDYVVTIPACGEDEYLPGAFESIVRCKAVRAKRRVLCIIVLNGNEARQVEFSESNSRSREWFRKNAKILAAKTPSSDSCQQYLLRWKELDILLIDRSQDPWLIDANQGVGLVRKIGADVALMLIACGKVKSRWIHSTDADARVPDDYFLMLETQLADYSDKPKPSCCIYPYAHIPDKNMSLADHQRYWPAVTSYELWLRYYVAGLNWAMSNYNYPSVGSLLAYDALSYVQVRGFPKRMAGEDFYFQNKLNKIGRMISLRGAPVSLLTRPSTRVPFGTGRGTIKIEEINEAGITYEVYHPFVYNFLKEFLLAVKCWLYHPELQLKDKKVTFISSLEEDRLRGKQTEDDYKVWLLRLLEEMNIFENLVAAEKRSKTIEGALSQFDDWFDGFRTLKLIHTVRDDLYGNLPLLDALQQSVFLTRPASASQLNSEQMLETWVEYFRVQ